MYRRVVGLWGGGDPDVQPVVDQARAKLAASVAALTSNLTILMRMPAVPLLFVAVSPIAAQLPKPAANTTPMLSSLDAAAAHYATVAKQIWTFAEVGYMEEKSSALLQSELKTAGFNVKAGVAGEPTAFVAEYGSGKPVIAILGEFDALPGLSQDTVPERKPLRAGGPGHGCGHHLFGTASAAAAIALKQWMQANNVKGTIRMIGTPAEEGGAGKVYMVRDGVFDDVDAVIAWHPGDDNSVTGERTMANISGKFRFHGVSAHAAAAPERGRSAARRRRSHGRHDEHAARARAGRHSHPLHDHERRPGA